MRWGDKTSIETLSDFHTFAARSGKDETNQLRVKDGEKKALKAAWAQVPEAIQKLWKSKDVKVYQVKNSDDLLFAVSGNKTTAERAFSDLYLVNGKGPAEKSIKGLLSSQSMWDDLDD